MCVCVCARALFLSPRAGAPGILYLLWLCRVRLCSWACLHVGTRLSVAGDEGDIVYFDDEV